MIESILKEKMGFEKNKTLVVNHNNTRVTAIIGGKTCKFRSKGEHNLALYFQFLKEQEHIKDWAFEQTTFRFMDETRGAKQFLVDFDILNNDGTFEYYEYKGWLKGSDVTKFRRVAKYRPEAQITLVMSGKSKKDANRIRQISKYAKRVIYARDILGPLKGFLNFI